MRLLHIVFLEIPFHQSFCEQLKHNVNSTVWQFFIVFRHLLWRGAMHICWTWQSSHLYLLPRSENDDDAYLSRVNTQRKTVCSISALLLLCCFFVLFVGLVSPSCFQSISSLCNLLDVMNSSNVLCQLLLYYLVSVPMFQCVRLLFFLPFVEISSYCDALTINGEVIHSLMYRKVKRWHKREQEFHVKQFAVPFSCLHWRDSWKHDTHTWFPCFNNATFQVKCKIIQTQTRETIKHN